MKNVVVKFERKRAKTQFNRELKCQQLALFFVYSSRVDFKQKFFNSNLSIFCQRGKIHENIK